MKPFIYITVAFLGIVSSINAQYNHKWITNRDGLSNNSINCILEDSMHNLWIGTWNGVNVYDGRNVVTWNYDKSDPNSVSNNIIYDIVEEDSMHMWVIAKNGLNRWNRQTGHFSYYTPGVDLKKSTPSFDVYTATVLPNSTVIVLYRDNCLFRFNKESEDFEVIDGFPSNAKQILAVKSHHKFYLINYAGELWSYDLPDNINGEIDTKSAKLVYSSHVQSMQFSGQHFIVNFGDHIRIYDPTANTNEETIYLPRGKNIRHYCCSSTGSMLIASSDDSLYRYSLDTKRLSQISDIPSSPIFSLYAGSQDVFWVGTDGHGVLQLYKYQSPFHTVNLSHAVRCFARHDNGTVLVGTKGAGIQLLDQKKEKVMDVITQNDGLSSNAVYCMRKNKYGDIFIGTDGFGLDYLSRNDKKIKHLKLPDNTLNFKSIYSIVFTNNDSLLWLGTSGEGLIKIELYRNSNNYRVKSVRQYRASDAKNSLSYNTIYTIVSDERNKSLWLGTRGGGVNKFDIENERFEQINLDNNDILVLAKGNRDDLWAGTNYGLNRISNTSPPYSIEEYTKLDGLADNVIRGIIKDHNNNFWISTNRGLSFLNSQTKNITNYTVQNGLQNDEFSDGAYYIDGEKNIYLGGVGGLSWFHPDKIRLRNYSPNLTLTNIRINNENQNVYERINADKELNLSYHESYVTLSFVVRDFINNENCLFRYRIIGFADEWIQMENNNNVILTKIPSGNYQLEIQYTNGDRVWCDNTYILHLNIAPPWWRSSLAYLAYSLLFCGVIFLVYRVVRNRVRRNQQYMLEQIEKNNQQKILDSKLNFFTNIAHEFFTPLTLIYGPAQQLLAQAHIDEYTKRNIQTIKNNANYMRELLNELMEFRKSESGKVRIRPEKIELKTFIDYVTDNYINLAEENNLNFQVISDNVSSITLDRSALEKVIFNLLSNAFKYTSEGGNIHLKVTQDTAKQSILEIRLRNSGKGLDSDQIKTIFNRFQIFENSNLSNTVSTGIGLNLTKNLVELMNGQIEVSSVKNEYVEFTVSLPEMEGDIGSIDQDNSLISEIELMPNSKELVVLIVDDEQGIRDLLRDILSPYYAVYEACNGEEACKQIEKNLPNVIICDIVMPLVNGFEFIKRVKLNTQTAHIPIIGISAKSSDEDHIRAYECGMDVYITKPFHPRHVLATMTQILQKQKELKKYFNSSRSAVTVKDGVSISNEDKKMLKDIILYIEQNLENEDMNGKTIAEFIGVSRAAFYAKLKELTGQTPSEYIRTIRLEYAARLLRTTNYTVSEIIYKTGFSSKTYFHREFIKQFKSTPKEYRKIED